LNQASKIIDKVRISTGGLNATVVDVRCILREALLKRATAISLCHNHPSGSIRPSREDDRLTQQVNQASQCMNIRLVDHVILTDGAFYSYADEGRI
ncbi:MAG: JAB domain-containing protein, partial [Bacteroides sp.]|nr:JAB domain-containing protein [Bacteroides sp.]